MDTIKVLNKATDNYLDILISNDTVIDNTDKIDDYIDKVIIDNTNPIVDYESEVFEPISEFQLNLTCLTGTTQFTTFTPTLYTQDEILSYNEKFTKSFYLIELYDSTGSTRQMIDNKRIYLRPNIEKQIDNTTLISTNVLNDLIYFNLNNFNILIPKYKVLNNLYMRVKFFDAKRGFVYFFKTINSELYIKINLDYSNNLWSFDSYNYSNLFQYNNPNELSNITTNNNITNNQRYNTDNNGDYINETGGYTKIQ